MMYNDRFKAGKYDTKKFNREYEMLSWINENSDFIEIISVYTSGNSYDYVPDFHILYKRIIGTSGEKINKKVII